MDALVDVIGQRGVFSLLFVRIFTDFLRILYASKKMYRFHRELYPQRNTPPRRVEIQWLLVQPKRGHPINQSSLDQNDAICCARQ